MGITIEQLGAAQWEDFRDLRLAALTEAPSAFWSSHADEAAYGQHEWTDFVTAATWLVARPVTTEPTASTASTASTALTASAGHRLAGMLGVLRRPELPDDPEVIGMWVAPSARRHGLGARLLREAATRAASDGAHGLTLWVLEHNDAAARLYRRHGYHFTGEQIALPRDPNIIELRMRKTLDASARRSRGQPR